MPNICWIWMAGVVLFLIIELASPTMIFISFVIGSLAAGVLSYFYPEAIAWQIGLFILASLMFLPFSRKLAKSISKDSPKQLNVDRIIGQIAIVTKGIDADQVGQVIVENETWQARASEKITIQNKVKIISLSGTTLQVERLEE